MRGLPKIDPAFRLTFALLLTAALLLLAWQCTRQAAGSSRVDWPSSIATKP